MIRLFKYEAYEVTIEPEALMLAPFKAVYSRDKHKDKAMAKQELAYIYFMGDPRSDYQYLVDPEVRSEEIIKGLGMPKNWKPDAVVERALTFYESFKPMSAGLLEDTRMFVSKYRQKLKELDFDNLEVRELKEIGAIIKQIPGLAKDLDDAEKTLSRDIIAETKARGSQTKALLEDED
jgi:hypothetical protein